MPTHRSPVISNRFEIVILVLMCFVISTRLIWLQIDDRNRRVTDEFYATSLLFNAFESSECPVPPDSSFPLNGVSEVNFLDTGALTSPGLRLSFVGICQFKRLSLDSFLEYAPVLIGLSTFFIALTARILTSNWVGGMLAAAVVLSRGTLLQGTHLAGTFWVLQPLTSLTILLLALYARSRNYRFLPPFVVACIFCTLVSPVMGIVFWALNGLIVLRLLLHGSHSYMPFKTFRLHLLPSACALVLLPLVIIYLHRIEPSSTQAVSIVITQARLLVHNWKNMLPLLGSVIAIFEQQDIHWLLSFAMLGIAATWKRYLPRGSGFLALAIISGAAMALLIDGGITSQATKQFTPVVIRRYYSMTDAVFGLEPLILGAGACYAWFAVRYIIILIFPSYLSVSHQRNNMK